MWSRLGGSSESWYGACHTSISLSSTRIGSFQLLSLSEADMEQSFSWPKVDMWCGPEITLCFSLPLLGCCCSISYSHNTRHICYCASKPHSPAVISEMDGHLHLPHSFPLSSNSDGIALISPPLHSDNVQFAELQVIIDPAPSVYKRKVEPSVENVLVSSDVVKWVEDYLDKTD